MDARAIKRFPQEIADFANTFVTLQEKRHEADYDPHATFARSSVQSDIALAEQAIDRFRSAAASDRRAFCAYVLLRRRD
jgi:hypothetical protein